MACTALPWLGMCLTQSTLRTINQVLSYLGWNFSALLLPFSSLLLPFPPPCGVGLWYSGKRWDWIVDGCRLSLGGAGVHRRLGKRWRGEEGGEEEGGGGEKRRGKRRGRRRRRRRGKGRGGKGEGRGVDRKKRDEKSDDRRRLGRESGEEWFVDSWKSLDSSGHTQNSHLFGSFTTSILVPLTAKLSDPSSFTLTMSFTTLLFWLLLDALGVLCELWSWWFCCAASFGITDLDLAGSTYTRGWWQTLFKFRHNV